MIKYAQIWLSWGVFNLQGFEIWQDYINLITIWHKNSTDLMYITITMQLDYLADFYSAYT